MRTQKPPLTKPRKLEILRRTREILARKRGWAKGGLEITNLNEIYPARCLAGAAERAARELGYKDMFDENSGGSINVDVVSRLSLDAMAKEALGNRGRVELDALIEDLSDTRAVHVYAFNDLASTSKEDILALVDAKIAELER